MRFVRITLYILFSILLLLGVTLFIVVKFYEKEVKAIMIAELNKYLNAPVIVAPEDIHLTVINSFPYASLEFNQVKILDATAAQAKDTLLKAGVIAMQFNIMDVVRKNYHIKKIVLRDMNIAIRIDKNGSDNYHFWKEDTSAASTGTAFSFALERVVLDNVGVKYVHPSSHQEIMFTLNNGVMKGDFGAENYTLQTDDRLWIDKLKWNGVTYVEKKSLEAALELKVEGNKYIVSKGHAVINQLRLDVTGHYEVKNEFTALDILIKGKDMSLQSALSLLPEKYKEKVQDYSGEGNFYFSCSLKGNVSAKESPGIAAKFGLEQGTISYKRSSVQLQKVSLKGLYVYNDGHDHLNIEPFFAQLKEGTLEGKFELNDFADPRVDTKIKADLKLEELQKFIALDTIESVQGSLMADISFAGKLPKSIRSGAGNKYIAQDIQQAKTSGELKLSIEDLRLKNNPLQFYQIEGDFQFNNNDVNIRQFTGRVSKSDFQLKGFFRNTLPYFFTDNQVLTIDAVLNSDVIDLDELLQDNSSAQNDDTSYVLILSENLRFKLESEIKHLTFRKFKADQITGTLSLRDKKLVADPVRFEAMDGDIVCSGMIDGTKEDKLLITCDASLRKINIRRLFSQFENFGQTVLDEKNIQGIVTSTIQFASVWTPRLSVDLDKLYARANMTIDKGELINYEPMKALSRFIKLSELEHIKFSTLHNEIEIKDRRISIPQMSIQSSALDVTCSGTHTFNNEIDYKFKLLLNDLLAGKAKKAKKENNEFGEEEDDGLGKINLFLSMTGTVDNPIIKYDRKSAVQKLKQDLKTEKQTLKSILKEEFGWFSKDTTLQHEKKTKKKEEDKKFIIKWDEDEKKEEEKDDDF